MKKILLLLTSLIGFNSQADMMATLDKLAHEFRNVRDFTVHKDEAYFSAQSTNGGMSVIIRLSKTNQQWGNPSIASFSGNHHDIEPFLAHDGLKLYFASRRPANSEDTGKDYDIWYVERLSTTKEWSYPINIGSSINTDKNEFYPSLAINNNLYFTANYSDSKGKDDIYVSHYKDGKYQQPYSLSESINSQGEEYNAFIAPDESYLIFGAYKRKDSLGSGDLYISYKDSDNKWSKAENMGDKVNSQAMDYCPYVDIDNQLLYLTSKKNNIKNQKLKNIKSLLKTFNSYENGMSRIYSTPFKLKTNSLKNKIGV
jgi:hypothetical protein